MPGWTPDEDDVIRRHVKTHSATQIAALLPGRSRASVIGRAWRLGESLAKDETTRRELEHPGRRHGRTRRPEPPAPPPDDPRNWPAASASARRAALAVTPRLVALDELGPRACRWPYGEGGALLFCGHPAAGGGPYCAAHHGLAYVPDPRGFDPEALAKAIDRRDGRAVASAA